MICAIPAQCFLHVTRINCIDLSGTAELLQISLWISIHWEFLGKMKVVKIVSRITVVKTEATSRMAFGQSFADISINYMDPKRKCANITIC